MVARKRDPEPETSTTRRRRPATPEQQINVVVGLAYDLVEKRLRNGTATSQEVTSVLRLGGDKERLELEKLRYEAELLKNRSEQIKNEANREKMYTEAIEAMRRYQGSTADDHV